MHLTIQKKDFFRSLSRTHSVADRKSSMPILSNILLSTDGPKTLRFAATDLYLSVTSTAPVELKTSGTIAVAARTLFEIVKNLPEGEVSLQVVGNHAVEIRSGKVRFKIPGMPGQDFPSLPSPGNAEFATLDGTEVGRLCALTHYSMSSDETRPHLAGALFEGDGKAVRMVTTDGHRLSKAEYKRGEGKKLLNFSMLVPGKGIGELRKLIDEAARDKNEGEKSEKGGDKTSPSIDIATAGGNAFFRRDDVMLSVKLVDEQFPPYSKVIPSAQSRKVGVSRARLIESLRRIALVASDKSGAVRFNVEPGTLRITSENPDVGEGTEELAVDFAGEPIEIGFNARYVLDVLGALVEDDVRLELGGQLDPGVIKPVGATDFVGVIMPMRI
ncbi:MAG TPA: DNA polymerase III subunit beta [Polyangiales bacterium]|nr:DNA polymerase III subunit beta [Polyangiales bacterium]